MDTKDHYIKNTQVQFTSAMVRAMKLHSLKVKNYVGSKRKNKGSLNRFVVWACHEGLKKFGCDFLKACPETYDKSRN